MKVDEELVEIANVTKSYQKGTDLITVLKGASLKINAGDMVSITGASGAGKSTLLHVMGTLDAPDSGELYYKGKNLIQLSSSALADFRNRELGFVFQFHH